MEIIFPSEIAIEKFDDVLPHVRSYTEMTRAESIFLTELLLRYKPKKVLEVGVSSGSSSVVILNALKDNADSQFFSVDYSSRYYKDESKPVGFLVNELPDFLEKRNLFSGGFVGHFLEEIGNDIDFCFIDTVHSIPGEILDFLMVLPYLKEEAIVVFHDTNLHTARAEWAACIVNNALMSAIVGEKFVEERTQELYSFTSQVADNKYFFPNVGGIKLDKNSNETVWNLFNLLTQPWMNFIKTDEEDFLYNYFEKHYGRDYANYFKSVLVYQKRRSLESYLLQQANNEQKNKNSMCNAYLKCKFFMSRILSKITS